MMTKMSVWQHTLKDQEFLGVNIWASDVEKIQDDYKIFHIPQYEVVHRSWQLVYLPDDPNLLIIEVFDKWLDE